MSITETVITICTVNVKAVPVHCRVSSKEFGYFFMFYTIIVIKFLRFDASW